MTKLYSNLGETHPSKTGTATQFKRILGPLAGLAMLSSPMLERSAMAQQSPGTYVMECKKDDKTTKPFQLTGGDQPAQVCAIFDSAKFGAEIRVQGRAEITFRIYPAVEKDKSVMKHTYRWTEDGVQKEEDANTTLSNLKCDVVDYIGTPKEVTVTVTEGSHRIVVQSPNGLLEVVKVVLPKVELPPQPPLQVLNPAQNPPQALVPDAKKPQQPTTDDARPSLNSVRSPFTLNFDRSWLNNLGDGKSPASTNELEAVYRLRLNPKLSLLLGLYGNLYQTSLTTDSAVTDVLSGSGNVLAGLAYNNGKHTLFAEAFGGLHYLASTVTGTADGLRGSASALDASYGGKVGYDYSDMAGFLLQASNSAFLPGYFKGYAVSPWGWVNEYHPRLDVNLSWLHLLAPVDDGRRGSALMGESNLLSRFTLKVPIFKILAFVPSAMIGGQVDHSFTSMGSTSGDAFFGGSVSMKLDRFYLEAGAASTLHGMPILLLNASVR